MSKTGHALSPDDITISKAKKLKAKTPLVRKGRKTPLKKVVPLKKVTTKDANFEGLADMLKTPAKALKKAAATPKSSVKKSPKAETPKSAKKTPAKATPKSAKKATPKATPKSVKKATPTATPKSVKKATPKATPKSAKKTTPKATPKSAKKATPKATPKSVKKATPKATPKSIKKSNVTFNTSATGTPNLNQTAFDFDSIKTPNVPLETFVSPLDSSVK